MFNIFQLKNHYLFKINDENKISFINKALWIDIIQSNDNECEYIQNILRKNKIDCLKLKSIKETERFFNDNHGGMHIRSFFFSCNDQNKINNSIVFFTIYKNCLYTFRKEKIKVFNIYQQSLDKNILIDGNAYELLLNLFEIKLNDLTDKIEHIYADLESLSFIVMSEQQIDAYDNVLLNLSELENIGWKIRINLLDTERAIKFLVRKTNLPETQRSYANNILDDITLLLPYNECVLHKVNFLTQSVMGLINIEQNRIIKIFSIVFLPPTLIASSYGMNFDFMPELQWVFGYPSAIVLMILTGLAPYLYFKYKNWL